MGGHPAPGVVQVVQLGLGQPHPAPQDDLRDELAPAAGESDGEPLLELGAVLPRLVQGLPAAVLEDVSVGGEEPLEGVPHLDDGHLGLVVEGAGAGGGAVRDVGRVDPVLREEHLPGGGVVLYTELYCTVLHIIILYLPGGGAALEGVADEVAAVLQPEEGSRALVVLQRLLVDGPVLHPRLVTQHGAGLLQLGPPPRQPLSVVDVSELGPRVWVLELAELGVVVVVEHHEHHQQRSEDRVGSAVLPVELSTELREIPQCPE